MCIYHCSQCLMSTFEYLLWSTCSVQSLVVPTGGMVFLLIQICSSLKGLYLVNEITTVAEVFKEFVQQQIEGCSDSIYCEDLRQHFLWVLCCFGNFWTVSDIVFKDDILPTFFWFVRQVRFASQTLSIPQHWLHIGYWKQLVLWKGKGLACETKPTVHKHKQKKMQPSSNKLEWMVQRGLIKC